MSIRFQPDPRTLLLCNYDRGGFIEPEMVKRRPAIVISPRLPHRDRLCAVVPLSTTEPRYAVDYVVRIDLAETPPAPFDSKTCWAKCDMLATVSLERLDLFRTARSSGGRRRYLLLRLSEEAFARVLIGIRCGLGMIDR